jgi:hypothetical protein
MSVSTVTRVTKDPHLWYWVQWATFQFVFTATNLDTFAEIVTKCVMILLLVGAMVAAIAAAAKADMEAEAMVDVS